MNAALEKKYGRAIDRSARKLRRGLTRDTLVALAVFCSASELLIDDMQPADAGTLRNATLKLALEKLGLTDAILDSAKAQLVNSLERSPSQRVS